jgi:hypothetical protein
MIGITQVSSMNNLITQLKFQNQVIHHLMGYRVAISVTLPSSSFLL